MTSHDFNFKLNPFSRPEIAAFYKEVLSLIQFGIIKLEFRHIQPIIPNNLKRESLRGLLDSFILSWGGFAVNDSWQFINQEIAIEIVDSILAQDIAYNSERMKVEDALRITGLFFKLFPKPLYFATNGTLGQNHAKRKKDVNFMASSSWTPVTSATFDTGVVVITTDVIGMLWMLDED